MSFVLIEGFDHEATGDYSQGGAGNQLNQKGWVSAGEGPINFRDGRLPYSANSHSMTVLQNNPLYKVLPSSYSTLIVGFGVYFAPSSGGDINNFFTIQHGTTVACTVGQKPDLVLHVYDSTGAEKAAGTTVIPYGTWAYIEVKLDIAGNTIEVHLNGVSGEVPSTSGSFGGSNVDTVQWLPVAVGSAIYVDDVYAVDTSGTTNNSFLGDVVVETLYPISDGTYTDWTPDTGTTHYTRVDENHLDGSTSYVHTTTAGAKDTYGMGNPTLTNTPVYGVQLNLGALKNDAGARTISPLIRQSSTDYTSSAVALSGSWFFYSWLLDQDPSGSNWLYTTVNNDEFGAELVS